MPDRDPDRGPAPWATLARLRLLRAGAGSTRKALRHLARSLGFRVHGSLRSIWVHGETIERFEAARDLLDLVRTRAPQLRRVFTASHPAVVDWLVRRFPNDAAVLAPLDEDLAVGWFLRFHAPRILVTLGPEGGLGPRALRRAARSGVPRIALDDGEPDARRAWEAIAPLVPDAPPTTPEGPSWRVPTLRDRLGQSRAWRALAPLFAWPRIDGAGALRERLGRPRSVLCLGNGPSSEDPRLRTLPHDCLMRVNWRWKERGLLAAPQVVFVGDWETLRAVSGCILALSSEALERSLLLRRFFAQGLWPLEYFTVDRVAPEIGRREWPARPTNGALMVAVAVALRPERLTIAGIDLYLHEDGRYPGDRLPENDYAQAHSRDVDVAILSAALADFRGELTVLGEPLRERLSSVGRGRVSLTQPEVVLRNACPRLPPSGS